MPNCSTCVLTQGFQRDCENKTGGGLKQQIYLINYCDLETGTSADFTRAYGSNVIEDIALAPDKCFYQVVGEKNVGNAVQTFQPGGSVLQTLNFTLSTRALADTSEESAQSANDIVDQLVKADGEFLAIVIERDGTRFLYGVKSGLELATEERNTGSAQTDQSVFTISLTAVEQSHAPAIASSYVIPVCS